MQLHYCETTNGNFGDDMNLWFWDHLLPNWQNYDADYTLFGIGTLLSDKALQSFDKILVCGSGTGYGSLQKDSVQRADIAWVRGPKTAKLLGLDPSKAISDPACMVTDMAPFKEINRQSGGTIFVPHRLTGMLDLNWNNISQGSDLQVVLPQGNAIDVISKIAEAQLVVAESMHGAILADAFRVPWIPVRVSHHFNDFKWTDWAESVEVDIEFHDALAGLKSTYFGLRKSLNQLRNLGRRRASTPAGDAPKGNFTNPNYLEKTERDFVKDNINRFSSVFERFLIRDLKRVARQAPQLSKEGVTDTRRQMIYDRIGQIEAQFQA